MALLILFFFSYFFIFLQCGAELENGSFGWERGSVALFFIFSSFIFIFICAAGDASLLAFQISSKGQFPFYVSPSFCRSSIVSFKNALSAPKN